MQTTTLTISGMRDEQCLVRFGGPRITRQILIGAELLRVDEDRRDHPRSGRARGIDQRHVPGMERAHRRDQRHWRIAGAQS